MGHTASTAIAGNDVWNVAPINLRPMAALGIPLGNIMIALAFVVRAAAAMAAMGSLPDNIVMGLVFMATASSATASIFGGGGVGVCNI